MSILGVNHVLGAYQYANKTQKTGVSGTGFTEQLKKAGASANTSRIDTCMEYLRSKYGNARIQNVGKDQQSLDKIGKSMSGNDVVIAPDILEQMANDPEKAVYYEGKIDDFFNSTPRLKASFAAQGLDYQPCGVVVHEDGSVTYIGGCADSPERVAEVHAVNKAKREKEAAQRKENIERSQEADAERKEQMGTDYKKQAMTEAPANRAAEASRIAYTAAPEVMASAAAAYENIIMRAAGILQ